MEQEDNAPSADAGGRSSEPADDGGVERDTAATSPSSDCNNTGDNSVCSSGATEGTGSVAAAAEEEMGEEEGMEGVREAVSPAAAPPRIGEVDDNSSPAPGVSREQPAAVVDDSSGSAGRAPQERQEEKAGLVRVESAPSLKRPSGQASSDSRNEDLRKALVGFYSVHNPGRIANLDVILAQYKGKEELLIERLERKYSANLSYARRAAAAAAAAGGGGGGPARFVSDDQTKLPPRPSLQQQKPQSQPTPPQQQQQQHQAPLHPSTGTAAAPGPSLSRRTFPRGPPGSTLASDTHNSSSAIASAGAGGSSSSSYITYLADQIRTNVEGFLPASANGIAGGAGGGNTVHPGSYAPPPEVARGEKKNLAAGSEGPGARGAGGASTSTTNTGTNSSTSTSSVRHPHYQHASGASDLALAARVRALEEERGGLLAACRRMQGKAEAAAREVAVAEEVREAGQRQIAGFAERAAAAERQAREATARLRALESEQAALRAEKEASARRCAAKHAQLLSAIDLQMSLRSQLEGLLEVVPPPSLLSAPSSKAAGGVDLPRPERSVAADDAAAAPDPNGASPSRPPDTGSAAEVSSTRSTPVGTHAEGASEGALPGKRRDSFDGVVLDAGGDSGGGGDEGGGGGLDEMKRRCSLVEVSLRASQREALEARRTRDAAESTVRQQREELTRLKERVSELEASLEREQEAGKGASQAASGLEAELDLRLGHLRRAEADLSEQADANARLREELRLASARLGTAAAARAALLGFCRQERTAVEALAAEQAARAEESAGMRGEEGLARGLELARMAEELGESRAAGLALEVDRLGKALFACRSRLARSEDRAQGLRRELERAAETIVGLSRDAIVSSSTPAPAAAAEDPSSCPSAEERSGGLTEEEALLIRDRTGSAAVAGGGGGEEEEAGVGRTSGGGVKGGEKRGGSGGGKGAAPAAGRSSKRAAAPRVATGISSAMAGYDVEL